MENESQMCVQPKPTILPLKERKRKEKNGNIFAMENMGPRYFGLKKKSLKVTRELESLYEKKRERKKAICESNK